MHAVPHSQRRKREDSATCVDSYPPASFHTQTIKRHREAPTADCAESTDKGSEGRGGRGVALRSCQIGSQNCQRSGVPPPPPSSPLWEQRPCQRNTRNCCCNFWNRGSWRILFLVVREDPVFLIFRGWEWYFRDTDHCPATFSPPFMALQASMMHCFAACVFSQCAQTVPLLEQQEVLLP